MNQFYWFRRKRFFRGLLFQIALLAGSVVLLFVSVDCLVNYFVIRRGAINDIVDIQSASVLEAKLGFLKRFHGYKVVLLGDSIIYGAVLHEHGDAAWREHNLANILARRIRKELPDRDVLVMNLGMNGALPGDLEILIRLLDDCNPDLMIVDVSLRSFSEDFAAPSKRLSRPWLAELDKRSPASCPTSIADSLEHDLKQMLRQRWALYRFRDFLQLRLLGNPPSEAFRDLHDHLDQVLQRPDSFMNNSEDEFILTMKARQRYQSIYLRPDHVQRQALEEMLTHLSWRNQKTVIFYAKENPETVGSLLDDDCYKELIAGLEEIITHTVGPRIRYLRAISELGPERYLDHVHVDSGGYEILAKHIWQEARGF